MDRNRELSSLLNDLLLRIVKMPHDKRSSFYKILENIEKLALISPDSEDLKLTNNSLKELRKSIKVFEPYRDVRKVCLFGSARTNKEVQEYQMAKEFANLITRQGFMLITGAGSGIMEAGNCGAELNTSFGLNISLPYEQKPNLFIPENRLIEYKYFFVRKIVFVKESDATVLFPGGFGTFDEGYENFVLLQTGKCSPRPIIMLEHPDNNYWQKWLDFTKEQMLANGFIDKDDLSLFKIKKDVQEAVNEITNFYKVYHSLKYEKNFTCIRLNHALSETVIRELNLKYKDILKQGKIVQYVGNDKMPCEEYPDKPRLCFDFNRFNYNKLIGMIDFINQSA
ncbi:MAG: LOG family protein [Candidatus Margulisiibacteriota bacterium]|jgi:hypothetical protein